MITAGTVIVVDTSVAVPSMVVGIEVATIPPLVIVETTVIIETCCEIVAFEGSALVLLETGVLRRGVVVTVRLPVAGSLVKMVALPVVSLVDDEVVRVVLNVDRKGVTVKFLVPEDEVDSVALVPNTDVLFDTGKGTLEEDPVAVVTPVPVLVIDSFVLVSVEDELCSLVVTEVLPVSEFVDVDVTEVSEVSLVCEVSLASDDVLLDDPEVPETLVAVEVVDTFDDPDVSEETVVKGLVLVEDSDCVL